MQMNGKAYKLAEREFPLNINQATKTKKSSLVYKLCTVRELKVDQGFPTSLIMTGQNSNSKKTVKSSMYTFLEKK